MSVPALTVYPQGQGSVSADGLNTFVQTCQNFAQLRTFVGLSGMAVSVQGASVPGDGGGGQFYWAISVSQPDNNSSVIIPPGSGGGGWLRIPIPFLLPALASAPSSPVQGQEYFDTTRGLTGIWTGSAWLYYAPINSPQFTGVPTVPTAAADDDSTTIANTAWVNNQGYAPLASPAFTDVPTAPTAAPGTDTTQVATTAFVEAAIGGGGGGLIASGWATWTGTSGAVLHNVGIIASIARGGTGAYTITLSPAQADANYGVFPAGGNAIHALLCNITDRTDSAFNLIFLDVGGDPIDPDVGSVVVYST